VRIAAVLCTFLFAAILRAQDTPSFIDKQIPSIETGVTAMTAVATALLQ
jgi:hypothetical protein